MSFHVFPHRMRFYKAPAGVVCLCAQRPVCSHDERRRQASAAGDSLSRVLDRQWLLPDTRIKLQQFPSGTPDKRFYVVRDDLLHPFLGGALPRLLDAAWPSRPLA